MEELKEYIKNEIREAREYFRDDEHFDDVFEQAGWGEEEMRIFDCGLIKGFEHALQKIEEYEQGE